MEICYRNNRSKLLPIAGIDRKSLNCIKSDTLLFARKIISNEVAMLADKPPNAIKMGF